eukprot:TRINITY_DN216_c0_g1_i2.p1 TRINITY_DN216_c0_g1~~TRINITY_DN216_c0_g1_i2.p1  ORF type:complete len:218 (-),score=40.68 TRINITY_DN216_c0_g1_i2:530-1183(-)
MIENDQQNDDDDSNSIFTPELQKLIELSNQALLHHMYENEILKLEKSGQDIHVLDLIPSESERGGKGPPLKDSKGSGSGSISMGSESEILSKEGGVWVPGGSQETAANIVHHTGGTPDNGMKLYGAPSQGNKMKMYYTMDSSSEASGRKRGHIQIEEEDGPVSVMIHKRSGDNIKDYSAPKGDRKQPGFMHSEYSEHDPELIGNQLLRKENNNRFFF